MICGLSRKIYVLLNHTLDIVGDLGYLVFSQVYGVSSAVFTKTFICLCKQDCLCKDICLSETLYKQIPT